MTQISISIFYIFAFIVYLLLYYFHQSDRIISSLSPSRLIVDFCLRIFLNRNRGEYVQISSYSTPRGRTRRLRYGGHQYQQWLQAWINFKRDSTYVFASKISFLTTGISKMKLMSLQIIVRKNDGGGGQ